MIDVDRLLAELDLAEGRTERARQRANEARVPWGRDALRALGDAEHDERCVRARVRRGALEAIR